MSTLNPIYNSTSQANPTLRAESFIYSVKRVTKVQCTLEVLLELIFQEGGQKKGERINN